MITLTPHQETAVQAICAMLRMGDPLASLRGLAGTGKTALIPILRDRLQEDKYFVAVGAPTNRAAMLLRHRGLADADTVHSLATQPIFDDPYTEACAMLADTPADIARYGSLAYDEAGDNLVADARRAWLGTTPFPSAQRLHALAEQWGPPRALRRIGIDGRHHMIGFGPRPAAGDVLILDEASMVGRELLDLCLQAFQRVVLVGDPGQLPPVNDVAVLASMPGVELREVLRQAEASRILHLAYAARRGQVRWHQSLAQYAPDVLPARYAPASQLTHVPILVWRNATRLDLTRRIRQVRGYGDALAVGEPLVCRTTDRQDRVDGFFNNALFRVVETIPDVPRQVWVQPEGDTDAPPQLVTAHLEELDGGYVEPQAIPFRFGYALTVHTAQGGEWPRVLIDMQDLRAQQGYAWHQQRLDEAAQWQYTALTRAKEQVILLYERDIVP